LTSFLFIFRVPVIFFFFFVLSMASSSSHDNNGIPLATLLEWYKIRDTFFGHNKVGRNIPLALEMASSCQHPDARWLTEACAGKDVTTEEDAKRVFSALGQNDARAMCFLWRVSDGSVALLRRSAELGFAFAQAEMAEQTRGEESFKFAQLAAAQGERDGFYWLAACFQHCEGCEKDYVKAKENFLRACELGDVLAMCRLGDLLEESSKQRWQWWSRAAALGHSWSFLSNFANQVDLFNSGSGSASVMFAIGQAWQGHVNEAAKTMFNDGRNFESHIGPAKQAIAFYEAQIKATKDAMRAWTQVGIRWKVVKDVRKLIAKLIWDSREEALYDVSKEQEQEEEQEEQEEQEPQPSARALCAQKRARNTQMKKSIFSSLWACLFCSHCLLSSSQSNQVFSFIFCFVFFFPPLFLYLLFQPLARSCLIVTWQFCFESTTFVLF
jgi:TPR repeat protein